MLAIELVVARPAVNLDQVLTLRAGAGLPAATIPALPIPVYGVLRLQHVANGVPLEMPAPMAVQGAGAQAVAAGDGAKGEHTAEELGLDRSTGRVDTDGARLPLHCGSSSYCIRGVAVRQQDSRTAVHAALGPARRPHGVGNQDPKLRRSPGSRTLNLSSSEQTFSIICTTPRPFIVNVLYLFPLPIGQ